MKRTAGVLLLVIALCAATAFAQVSVGTPAFSSMGGGPADAVNLGNLNVHLVIPVLHKAGRGVPFVYDLLYDSSIWTPVVSGGVKQWQPNSNWGWSTDAAPLVGYVTVSETTSTSGSGSCMMTTYTYSNYVYHDKFGATHPFYGTSWERFQPCSHPPFLTSNLVTSATDGSGYSISAFETTYTVTSPSGASLTGPANGQNGAGSYTDANGNQITVNSSGQFFDTLNASTPVLTVAGSGTPSSPVTLTYTPPSGTNVAVTMQYTQYTVATNFGFTSGTVIHDYGATSVPLVSEIDLPDGSKYLFTYEATGGSCTPLGGTTSCVTGRIASVTLPTGGSISYSYSGGPNSTGIFSDGSTAGLSRTLSPGGTWNYSRTNTSGTPGPSSLWTTTVQDANSTPNYTVINFAEDSAINSTSTVATYNMYETQRLSYQGNTSGTLLVTNTRCYNANYTSCGTANVTSPITQTDAYTQLPGGQTRLSEVLYNGSYTGSGLVSKDDEYDYGVTTGSAPGTSHLIRETDTAYASLTNDIINLPSLVKVYDWTSGDSLLSSTGYGYDETAVTPTSGTPQHISITGSRGNLTTLAVKANSGPSLSRTYTYYDTGNPSTVTDFNGATTTYTYASGSASCYNSFVTSVSEPLSLSRSMSWNCTGGVATSATDENSQTVSTSYTDADFWRPYSTTDQLSNVTTISYSGQTAVESTLSFNSGNSIVDARATIDGFGRSILGQRLQGPSASNYDTTEVDYNIVGLPSRSTMPFSASAGGTNLTAPGVNTVYDALGRPTSSTDANGGTTSYTYTNNDTLISVSGSQTFKKQLEYDGLGRLSSVCEISSTLPGVGTCGQTNAQSGYWTKYTYDAAGHLLTVTQNAQASSGRQTRSYSYDMAGRLTSETNPETGTVSYTYDSACGSYSASAGDLTKRVDNAGNTTCYAYDALHRVTDAGYSGPICRHYRYDNSPTPYNGGTPPTGVTVSNTLTRLEEASTDQCSFTTLQTDEWFSYSPRGELTDVYESTPNSGTYYHTTASYWASGALESLSGIPSVPTLYYGGSSGAGLDGEGRYTQVTASSSPNPVTSVSYSTSSTSNPLGALTGVTYGSSDNDSFSYDPNTGRAATYSYSVNGSADTGTLTWNTNGTLASLVISDAISGTSDSQSCTFTYDDLARIGGQDANGYSADCGPAWQQLFSYDAFGNINKSGSLSFTPTYTTTTPTNQFSSIPGVSGPYYDSNGNLTTDNLNTYTWDPNWGNMTSVSTGSTTVTASYDALGRVVEQGSGSGYAQILWSPAGKAAIMNGTTLTKAFVGLPGGGTAVYTSSGLAYYRHADWLGSSRLASTQAQGLYSSTAYAPFGESYATAGTTDASFTGQNSDTVSSLYDFIFRRESPSQGRWISPDPAGLAAVDPTTPQTWNRYGYVANNPTGNIDQMGLWRQFPGACASSADYQCGGGYIGPGWGGDPGSGGGTFVWISNWQEVTTVNTNPEVVGTDNDPWQAQIIGTEWDDFGQFVYLSGPSISLPQTQNPGGPGGSAPSNGTKSPSCGKAWGKAIAGTLLDATGLIPGEGTIASGIKIAGTLGGIALSASGSFQDAAAGGVFTGVGMYADATKQDIQTLGKDVAEGIPGLGTIVSGVAVVWDLGSGAKSIYNCYQGVTE